jgi:signal transduction histidine kinase/CheY-like chemotaxis protein
VAHRSPLDRPAFDSHLLQRIWYNRPVHDEAAFERESRSHSFGFVLVVSWTLCIIRTGAIVYQQFFSYAVRPEPILPLVLDTALLYWTAPLIFSIFGGWSRHHYHWILDLLYGVYFINVGLRVTDGPSQPDEVNVMLLVLIITSVIFVRIPFRHAVGLTATATVIIDLLAIQHFGFATAFRLLLSCAFTLAMALYTSWGIEERERGLFNKRHEAEAAAAEEQQQRIRAEQAATAAFIASSEKGRLHDQLSRLYSQRELLIRGLHHDANQSLHIVGSALFNLRQKIAANPAFDPLADEIGAVSLGTADLDALIAGMYDLVKLGKYEPTYAPLSVNALLNNIDLKFAGAAAEKGLRFVVKQRADDVFLWTDATAMERILTNLVSNAIKYTPKGGVLVGTVRHGQRLRVDVWDTGVGIPDAQKESVFSEFVRLEQSGVGDVKGLGLGLAIVKLFRDKLAGHYLEHSSRVGRGSRFSISVPHVQPPVTLARQPGATLTSVGLTVEQLYVVVVEDNLSVQASLARIMGAAGYRLESNVRFAGSIAEVTQIFDRMPHRAPNVVVCDFRLHGGENANQVIQLIDARFSWERVPVVVYSAEIEPAVDLSRSHVRVIVKTSNPSLLLQEMESVIVAARQSWS